MGLWDGKSVDVGADTYNFYADSGRDTIFNADGDATADEKPDVLYLDQYFDDLVLARVGQDLVIAFRHSEDRLTVSGYFDLNGSTSATLDLIYCYDHDPMTYEDVLAALSEQGTQGETFTATPAGGTLSGGSFDDALNGLNGVDLLNGGGGDDVISAGSGKDVLNGGTGNDTLIGGVAADIFKFDADFGDDVITDAQAIDKLSFGAGISPTALRFSSVNGNDLVISQTHGENSVTITGYFFNNAVNAPSQMLFANGTALSVSQVKAKALVATAGNDILYGYASSDALIGSTGDDVLYGAKGNDALQGQGGTDRLEGGEGNDKLNGGSGADVLFGGAGDDRITGGTGADELHGDAGNDVLNGSAGADQLFGGDGADQYIFGAGSGTDTIFNEDSDAAGTNVDSVLIGGTGLIVFFPNGLHSLRGEIPANAGIHSPFPVRY